MKVKPVIPVSDETRKATDIIFRKYYKQVFGYANYITNNRCDAQDVTTDVFAKIVRLYDNPKTRFNGEKAALGTWVRTVTNSVVIDFFRTNHQDHYHQVSDFVDADGIEMFQFHTPSTPTPEKIMVNNELKARLDKAFGELKPKYREIASLYFEKEQSYEEIADELNVPMGTVKGMISRARQKLQKELDGMYIHKKEMEIA